MFDERFEVFLADTDFAQCINKQIRYRVFCLERGFEDPDNFPNGEEQDEWDQQAAHFIVREKSSGRWVASTRIIHPKPSLLPVEQHNSLSPGFLTGIDRNEIGEISRFCIIRQNILTNSGFSQVSRSQFDWIGAVDSKFQYEITWGMLRAVTYYGLAHGLEYSYMFITNSFARLLRRMGIVLYQSGMMTEFKGQRAPFLVDFSESIPSVSVKSSQVRELFMNKHLAYLPVVGLDHEYAARIQQELDDCSECRIN